MGFVTIREKITALEVVLCELMASVIQWNL